MSHHRNYRPRFVLLAFIAVLLLAGCGDKPDTLTLTIDGREIDLPLEKMDVYLIDPEDEAEFPEIFEIVGKDVVLVGTFPLSTRVGYGEKFEVLSGKAIAIAKEGGDVREPKRSSLVLPEGQALVESGSFTVTKVGKTYDAKTPLVGTVTLLLRTAEGTDKVVTGTFRVRGTTWG